MRKSFFGAIAATLGLASQAGAADLEVQMFETAKERGTVQAYSIYLETFPNGRFVQEAQLEAGRGMCSSGERWTTSKTGQASWNSSCVPYS